MKQFFIYCRHEVLVCMILYFVISHTDRLKKLLEL